MRTGFYRLSALLMLATAAACNDWNTTPEVRSVTNESPLRATWQAIAAPIGTSPVRATLAIRQRAGFRMDLTFALTGAPGATYQWRIFRGDCTLNVAAVNATSGPAGLLLFATLQSYPDAVASAAGTVTVLPVVAGSLDSLTAYSVRVRPAQTATAWNGTNPVACGNLQRSAAG